MKMAADQTTQLSRLDLAPPPVPRSARALLIAATAHVVLIAALTWGVSWKRSATEVSFDAELWSALPMEAAPKATTPPPTPEPPKPDPQPEPTPVPPPPPPPPKPVVKTPEPPKVDIALEKEKLRLQKEKEAEIARLEEQKKEKLRQEKLKEEQQKKELEKKRLEKERLEKERLEKERQEKLQREKREREKKLAAEKKAAEEKARAEKLEKVAEKARNDQMQRMAGMAGMAGATGDANAKGTAARSSGPSASYAGRIRARVKPNIVYVDEISGNPAAEVTVLTSPDGTIIGRSLARSSGVPSWDEAVLKAIDKTQVLPRDTDGTVPSSLTLIFRPKD